MEVQNGEEDHESKSRLVGLHVVIGGWLSHSIRKVHVNGNEGIERCHIESAKQKNTRPYSTRKLIIEKCEARRKDTTHNQKKSGADMIARVQFCNRKVG